MPTARVTAPGTDARTRMSLQAPIKHQDDTTPPGRGPTDPTPDPPSMRRSTRTRHNNKDAPALPPRLCDEQPEQSSEFSKQHGNPSNTISTPTSLDHFTTDPFQGHQPARRTTEQNAQTTQRQHGQTNRDKTTHFSANPESTQQPNTTMPHDKTSHNNDHTNGMSTTHNLPNCGVYSNPDMGFTSGAPTPPAHTSAGGRPHGPPNRPERQGRGKPQPGTESTGRARRAESNSSGTKPAPHVETLLRIAPSAHPEQRLCVQVSVRQREVHPVALSSELLGLLRHASQRLRLELGADSRGPTPCSSRPFLDIFIEQHSNKTSTVGQFRDYSAARLPTRSSSPNEPWERAFICQALRSKAAPWRRFAAARPWSQARSPSL